MNVPTANSYMLLASNDVNKTYWFCLSMILLICLEIFVGIVVGLCLSCRSDSTISSSFVSARVSEKVDLYSNEEERLVQYPAAQTTPMNYSGEVGPTGQINYAY